MCPVTDRPEEILILCVLKVVNIFHSKEVTSGECQFHARKPVSLWPWGLKAEWGSNFVRENSGHPSFIYLFFFIHLLKTWKPTWCPVSGSQFTLTYCTPILPAVYRRHCPCQLPSWGILCLHVTHLHLWCWFDQVDERTNILLWWLFLSGNSKVNSRK